MACYPADDALAMAQWEHGGGFSVDASVRIEAADRAGRERLLRYCARPPFVLDRLRELDPERPLYESSKSGSGGIDALQLTPLKLSPSHAGGLFWFLLISSSLISHAPKSFQHKRLFG